LRLLETSPPTTRTALVTAAPGRAAAKTPTVENPAAAPIVVLPRRAGGNAPFLAQYLAQDGERRQASGPSNPQLWRQRDAAYRSAALPARAAEINLEI
jgi:hypothetical protein